MIKNLINPKYAFFWSCFHVGIGFAGAQSRYAIIAWIFTCLIAEFPNLANIHKSINIKLNYVIIYICSFEVVSRMSKCSPLIPYEISKYLFTILFIYGISLKYNKGSIGLLMLLLIIPGMFYDLSGETGFYDLVFNALGAINVGLAVIYFKGQIITKNQISNMIKLGLYPLISVLAFAFIRTPDYETIEFGLSSNFETAGGFGSNQVSTVLGLALVFIFLLWLLHKEITGSKIFDGLLIMGFIFQGLLTFSRGGMIGAGVTILSVIFILTMAGQSLTQKNPLPLPKIIIYIIPLIVIGTFTFQVADNITGNNLSLRYQGETAGTIGGSKEMDFNSITTNRFEIFMDDIALWQDHLLFGTGVGASSHLRNPDDEFHTAAHVEFSRLLAEHGLLGLIYFVLLLSLPFGIWKYNNGALNKAILISFYIIAIYTTFHAAMRTFVTPLLVGMSLVTIIDPKKADTTVIKSIPALKK